MLRELDSRGNRIDLGQVAGGPVEMPPVVNRFDRYRSPLLVGGGVLVLTLTLLAGYWVWMAIDNSPIPQQGPSAAVSSGPVATGTPTVLPPVAKKVVQPTPKQELKPRPQPVPQSATATPRPLVLPSTAKPASSTGAAGAKAELPKPANITAAVVTTTAPFSEAAEAAPAPVIQAVVPQRMRGSLQRQPLRIKGRGMTPESRVVLCWPSNCATLAGERLRYLSDREITLSIASGNNTESWTVQLINPDGRRSNSVILEIEAADRSTSMPLSANKQPVAEGRAEQAVPRALATTDDTPLPVGSINSAAAEPDSIETPSISALIPQQMRGSDQRQPLRILGSGLSAESRVVLCWPSNCTTLAGDRVTMVSDSEIQLSITTGLRPERWSVQLLNPDGRRSERVTLEVIAPAPMGNNTVTARALTESGSVPIASAPVATTEIERTILPLTPLQLAEEQFVLAERESRLGHPKLAVEGWQRALQLADAHHPSRERLASDLIAKGRVVEAQQLIEDGYRRYPQHSAYVLILARIALDRGEESRAVGLLEQRLAQPLPAASIYAMAAALYQRSGERQKSISAYQSALELEPAQAAWWLGLGISLEQNMNEQQALQAYLKARDIGGLQQAVLDYLQTRIQQIQKGGRG